MCSQKQTSYNEMRLDIFLVAHTKLRYRLIIQPTVRPQTPVGNRYICARRALYLGGLRSGFEYIYVYRLTILSMV